MDTIGLLLLVMGLFSSQWVCFLVVLVMSFSQIQKLGAWAVFLDSLVTVIIYAFAILNVWGIERSGFFNGREKWAKGFENQRV